MKVQCDYTVVRLINSIAVIVPTAEGLVLHQFVEQLSLVEKIKTLNSPTRPITAVVTIVGFSSLSLTLCTSAWISCRYTCNISRAHFLSPAHSVETCPAVLLRSSLRSTSQQWLLEKFTLSSKYRLWHSLALLLWHSLAELNHHF